MHSRWLDSAGNARAALHPLRQQMQLVNWGSTLHEAHTKDTTALHLAVLSRRNSDHVAVEAACRRSLAALKLDYLDL